MFFSHSFGAKPHLQHHPNNFPNNWGSPHHSPSWARVNCGKLWRPFGKVANGKRSPTWMKSSSTHMNFRLEDPKGHFEGRCSLDRFGQLKEAPASWIYIYIYIWICLTNIWIYLDTEIIPLVSNRVIKYAPDCNRLQLQVTSSDILAWYMWLILIHYNWYWPALQNCMIRLFFDTESTKCHAE